MAKIVVLEDDASTRRLVVAVLKEFGHDVTDADNGAEGLLTIFAEQPDLVISDVDMPKINGFEVLSDIRSNPETAETPVILLTALSSEADRYKGISQGADDYITKPFEPKHLMRSVHAQLVRLSAKRTQVGMPPVQPVQPIQLVSPSQDPPEYSQSSFRPDRDDEPLSGFAATSAGELMDTLPGMDFFPALDDSLFAPPIMQASVPKPQRPTTHVANAIAVTMSLLNEEQLQSNLPIKVWRSLLRELFIPVSRDANLKVADYLSLRDARITLYFVDRNDGQCSIIAARALQALVRSSTNCRRWASELFRDTGVPAIRVGIGLHAGPIDVVRNPIDFGGESDVVEGMTTNLLNSLREGEPRVMWRVMATKAALLQSSGLYRLGTHLEVSIGTQDIKVYAIQGVNDELAEGGGVTSAHWI